MAEAKAVCGSCGASVVFGAERCASCGEHLTWASPAVGGGAGRACLNCGQLNEPGAALCSSCGAKLGVGRSQRQQKKHQQVARDAKPSWSFEPWQIVSVVAILALVAVVAYVLISGDKKPPLSSPAAGPGPMTMPPMMQQQKPVVDIAALEAAANANPGDPKAVLMLANGLHDNGDYLRAVEVYKKYLKAHPKDPDARVDMGICYYQLGMQDTVNTSRYFGLAITEMEAALRGTPTHQPAAFNLGVVNLQKGDLDVSNRWFRKAVELGPSTDLGTKAQRMLQQHSSMP